ncbi:hypothetical protein [Streptomyces sp. PBH53]|uniref:hypothetical protein n=1 Tax=Streptomyces sp. PBH53 TaxID=1577075 RepID=UPI000AE8D336|nr:hypothetical protein [Streptomyces sp. PBH53]
MIRAGRSVYTLSDLAALEGRSLGTYRNRAMHRRPGHPAPVSSSAARVLLYDVVQVDAWRAGLPVPPLPEADDPADLLDQYEAAALAGVTARTWESYRHDAALAQHVVRVRGQQPPEEFAGVEHWPREVVLAWLGDRPGRGHGGGRPPGARDALPRAEIVPRTAALLAERPTITAAEVSQRLGIHQHRAHQALAALRADAVAALLEQEPAASAQDVAARLGYPIRTARTALAAARARTGEQPDGGAAPTLF